MSGPHLWVRAEQRPDETRVGITPAGVRELMAAGFTVTVEDAPDRVIPTKAYAETGCAIVRAHSWPDAPRDAIIFGLKELAEDGTPLPHQHIMFGHAYKGQSAGRDLLRRFQIGKGTLLDLEYLTGTNGRRVAAFGYWAGFAGAAVALRCWLAQTSGKPMGPVVRQNSAVEMTTALKLALGNAARPSALIIGALGRVGTGASDFCEALGVAVTKWDMAETAAGGSFPQVLDHDIFLNCVLAGPQTPVFVPKSALAAKRKLSVIGDIACDPDSSFNPIPVYGRTTTWAEPAIRVHEAPPLDVIAIDNLPSKLPRESSEDFASQLLPTLRALNGDPNGIWERAEAKFREHAPQ